MAKTLQWSLGPRRQPPPLFAWRCRFKSRCVKKIIGWLSSL